MAVRIIKKSWWVDFRFDHTRYRKRSPENSRAGAQAYEAVLRQKLARGNNIEAGCGRMEDQSFEEFAWRWFEDYVVPNNRPTSQRDKSAALRAELIPFFGRLKLSEITAQHVEQFKAQQARKGVTNATINARLAKIQTCLNTAYEWGALKTSPPRVRRLKCPPARTEFLSPDETKTLLELAGPTLRELLLTTLRTGLRQGELRALQWSSIDWENRILIVRHTLTAISYELWAPKNNRERRIPLDPEVYEILLKRRKANGFVFAQRSGKPIGGTTLNRRLAKLCRQTGLRRITWHTLRHTFATQLAMSGAPLVTIQALMGHSNITMTTRYAHAAPSSLREAIGRLGAKPGIPGAWATGGQPETKSDSNKILAAEAIAEAA